MNKQQDTHDCLYDTDFISELSALRWLEETATKHGKNAAMVVETYYDLRPYSPTRAEITRSVKEALEEHEVFIP